MIFRTRKSSSFVSSHLKLFKDRFLLKIRFNALTSKLLYSLHLRTEYKKIGPFLERVSILGEIFLERGANLESQAAHTHPKNNTQVPPPPPPPPPPLGLEASSTTRLTLRMCPDVFILGLLAPLHVHRIEIPYRAFPERVGGLLEKEDRGSKIKDRGWRMERRGSRIGDRGSRIG